MGILFVIFAGSFTAFSNLCMRKSIDNGGTSKSFLMIQLSIAFLVAILLNPVRTGSYEWNMLIVSLGLLAGFILGFMMLSLGRALEKGPPGLTFAALSGATVMPGLLMAMIFGSGFGFEYRYWHALGSILVLGGLFWAGWGFAGMKDKNRWLLFSISAFSAHVLFLVMMQWRSLIINHAGGISSLLTSSEAQSQWFMPMIYLAAALLQTIVFLKDEKRMPSLIEWGYGFLGGATNSLSTFFLIWATEVATGLENATIFPVFSVTIILLCNAWGQKLYQEKVNWKASQVCALGLFIGTVDWKAVMSLWK